MKKQVLGMKNEEKKLQKILTIIITIVTVYGFAVSSHANLVDNLDGTVTDNTTNLMWLKDANLASTNGFPAYGMGASGTGTGMSFDDCIAWVSTLNSGAGFAGHTDWRMPTAINPDGSGPTLGWANAGATGEMLNLSYTGGVWRDNPGPFINLQLNYWTGTSGVDADDGIWNFLNGGSGGATQSILQSKLVFVGKDPVTHEDIFLPRRFSAWAVRDAGITSVPDIEALPLSYDFGSMAVGNLSLPKTFTISNRGDTENLSISTINITGTDSSEFYIQNDQCSEQPITPAENCTVEVVFSPITKGTKNSKLSIPSNDHDTPILDIPLFGTAIIDPVSDVNANGSDGPLIIALEDTLNITLTLDPGSHLGVNSDWWIFIFYHDQGTGSLTPIVNTGFQSPLFNLPSTTILNTTNLPAGNFLFFFGVDMVPNGTFDGGQLYGDIVLVIIQ